jgi:DNA-binding MarR family transcriptional regulator
MSERHSALEEFTPYLMNRIIARYNKGVDAALKEIGISVPQMRTLAVLAEGGPLTINELSVLTVIKQSTLSRALDVMEKAELIRREAPDTDNRQRFIHLTETGRAAYATGWPEMVKTRDAMLRALDPAEREVFNRMLQRVLHSIRHHDF